MRSCEIKLEVAQREAAESGAEELKVQLNLTVADLETANTEINKLEVEMEELKQHNLEAEAAIAKAQAEANNERIAELEKILEESQAENVAMQGKFESLSCKYVSPVSLFSTKLDDALV